MTTLVKVIRVPGQTTEIGIEAGTTLEQALSIAGESASEGEALRVNGQEVPMSTPLNNNDLVTISKGAKGNG